MIQIIGEIGINHNSEMEVAKKLIDLAAIAGFDYVKFQKRSPDLCVPEDQKNKIKKTPWGDIKYIDYKHKIEFGLDEYFEIYKYCEGKIKWFASVWDLESAEFMTQFTDMVKIPSAMITDIELLEYCRKYYKTRMMSTGMSTEKEIEKAVEVLEPEIIFHCNASYPAEIQNLALNYIKYLKNKYTFAKIGYSGHEFGLVTTFSTVAMGVEWIERHITLDRMMWGSDHLSSVEPVGMFKLVKGIRDIERALGEIKEREVFPDELDKRKSLRGS